MTWEFDPHWFPYSFKQSLLNNKKKKKEKKDWSEKDEEKSKCMQAYDIQTTISFKCACVYFQLKVGIFFCVVCKYLCERLSFTFVCLCYMT